MYNKSDFRSIKMIRYLERQGLQIGVRHSLSNGDFQRHWAY